MSWNPENYADYAFSEYTQPSESNTINYADPRFYQAWPESGETPHSLPQPPQPPTAPAYGYPAVLGEYHGPTRGMAPGEEAQHGAAQATNQRKKGLAGLGGIGVALGLLLKFGLFGSTALLSVIVYAGLFGWEFGIGLVILLFVHEMGHAIVMKLKGIPIGGMVFIPMLGAAVFMNRMPENARGEAEVGIAGPIAGALASLVCLLVALGSPTAPGVWAALAYFGFLMNLFNLVPMVPFDGGRITAAIDRRMWIVGLIMLVAVYVWELLNGAGAGSIFLLLIIILAVTQFWSRNKGQKHTPEAQAYYAVPLNERIVIALAYFGLAAALAFGMSVAHGLMFLPPSF